MPMNVNDFFYGFKVVDDAITRKRANELAERQEARQMAWEDEERGRKRQEWQRTDQLRDVTALQAKIEAGTATPEEVAQARQTYLPGAKSMKPVGSFSAPTKREVVNRAVTGMQRPAMGAGGYDGEAALEGLASGRRVQDDMADDLKKMRAQADEATKRRTDVILGAFAKIDEAKQNGQTPILTDEEGEALISPVIQTPYFDEENLAQQYQALKNVEGYLGNLAKAKVPGRVAVNDPGLLQDVALAYPQIVKGSNLKNARPSAVYIDPSPDGDPTKMKIMVGIAGEDEKGNPVDGILTKNRTSDPNDEIVALTTGEWLSMAEAKRRMLDGMVAVRRGLGDEKAYELAQKARQTREVSQMLAGIAQQMPAGNDRDKLMVAAHLANTTGDINTALALAEKAVPKSLTEKIKEAVALKQAEGEAELPVFAAKEKIKADEDIRKKQAEIAGEMKKEVAKQSLELSTYVKKLRASNAIEKIPKEGMLADYLLTNGYAKSKEEAWRMANHSKDNPEKLALEIAQGQMKAQAEAGITPDAEGYRDGKTIARDAVELVRNVYAGIGGNSQPGPDVNGLLFGDAGTKPAPKPQAQPAKPQQRGMAPPQTFAQKDEERRRAATEEYNRKMEAARRPSTVSYELPSIPRFSNNVEAFNPFTGKTEVVPIERTQIDPNRKGYNKRIVVPQ
jgi:hypothetical protein